ncbi:hypothetical protein [Duganella vulcania]|uniref:Uncharacterized protein n=1 Tax=Duganella vulcania TaxID=2692166 RepID=A0A845GS46_9BURK|nr:hypothetical protein [Duganella vulcania]MYM96240.1 hypothetical protein [Duganella vulcania]
MSLQYYDINIGLTGTQKIAAQGRYIYYYTGTTPLIAGGATPAAAGNQAIKVQAGQSGNTILLMPGQSYRLDESDKAPTEWILSNFKASEVITGQVMVGEGDFRDSNTSNTSYVKLDATFANNVQVTNTPASRVPVTADLSQTIPVSIAGTVNVSGNTMNYQSSWTNNVGLTANVPVQIVAPVTNVNGIMVNRTVLFQETGTPVVILAKASAPTSWTDGDVIAAATSAGTGVPVAIVEDSQIKVPAGRGLWVVAPSAANQLRSMLYTVL